MQHNIDVTWKIWLRVVSLLDPQATAQEQINRYSKAPKWYLRLGGSVVILQPPISSKTGHGRERTSKIPSGIMPETTETSPLVFMIRTIGYLCLRPLASDTWEKACWSNDAGHRTPHMDSGDVPGSFYHFLNGKNILRLPFVWWSRCCSYIGKLCSLF